MAAQPERLDNLDELRAFVKRTLCDLHRLDADRFELSESLLIRKGETCGLTFSLQGPRSVRLTAIWACQDQAVYFFDSLGQRFSKVQLPATLELALAAA